MPDIVIRPIKDSDAEDLFTLVGGCFAEYEGVFLDRDDLDSDLKAYQTYIHEQKGQGFAALLNGKLVASVACAPSAADTWEVKRLYLSADLRGAGMGLILLNKVEAIARTAGAHFMDCWSDSRFKRAHRFYEREGYIQQSQTRHLGDISNTEEYYYIKELKG